MTDDGDILGLGLKKAHTPKKLDLLPAADCLQKGLHSFCGGGLLWDKICAEDRTRFEAWHATSIDESFISGLLHEYLGDVLEDDEFQSSVVVLSSIGKSFVGKMVELALSNRTNLDDKSPVRSCELRGAWKQCNPVSKSCILDSESDIYGPPSRTSGI